MKYHRPLGPAIVRMFRAGFITTCNGLLAVKKTTRLEASIAKRKSKQVVAGPFTIQ